MSNTALQPPSTVSISSPGAPQCVSSYNMSEYHLDGDGYWKIRLLRSPGVFLDTRPTKGLHTIRSFIPKWLEAQQRCPSIGPLYFSRVIDMIDPATGAPTVALVSPYYRKGNILEVKATKQQRVRWLIQICDAVQQLHKHHIVHANIHPRNILIRDDNIAVLTDACIYSLTVEHYIKKMSSEEECRLRGLATICCKTAAAVDEHGGKIPSTKATNVDDIFGLAMSIWMVFQGKEPWLWPRAICQVVNRAHGSLPKPDDMKDRLWGTLHHLFCQNDSQVPTVEVIRQRLEEEIVQ